MRLQHHLIGYERPAIAVLRLTLIFTTWIDFTATRQTHRANVLYLCLQPELDFVDRLANKRPKTTEVSVVR